MSSEPLPPVVDTSSRSRGFLKRAFTIWSEVEPGSRAWSGAAVGLLLGVAVTLGIRVLNVFSGWVSVLALLIGVTFGLARALVGGLVIVALMRLFALLPARYRLVLVGSLLLLSLEIFSGSLRERLAPTLFVIVSSTVAGAAVGVFFRWRTSRTSRARMLLAIAGFAVNIAGAALGLRWLFGQGNDNAPTMNADARSRVVVPALDLPDPGAAGAHRARRIFYGSGADRRRPEYGASVDLRTQPVDGRPFLREWGGVDGWARTRYLGYGADALPINGRLWVPEGEGPFPLVLVVHGGHPMDDPSEPGYDYLGEHLASHGFLFASIDENFLNGGPWASVGGGLSSDSAARGWLVLEHLRALRGWNAEAGSLLHGKVDLGQITLVGHSRGGEAIALAALFNKLPAFPDDATVRFDYGFGIRGLVALSTTDRQYLSGGAPIALQDIDYLALQGSNDGDVDTFLGAQQYDRITLSGAERHVKAAVYVHRANHGQFNRVWGRRDKANFPKRLYFNRKPLLSAEEQERVARAYVTAFLFVSARGDQRYLPFLEDHRAGKAWLPDTVYLNRFETSSRRFVSRFEEDVDVSTTTLPGGRISGEHLTVWREQAAGSVESRAVFLGWDAATAETARYTVELPESAGPMADPAGALVFEMADGNEPPNPRGQHAPGRSPTRGPRSGVREPIDLSIELVDREGHAARLPLSAARPLQPQIQSNVWKAWLGVPPRHEIVFQTFRLPLAGFMALSPDLDPRRLRVVRFVFDRTPAGVVVLDDLGFASAE